MYSHKTITNDLIDLPVGKVVCVGRNYIDHIQELNNPIPQQALLFIKPQTSLCDINQPIDIPMNSGECHNELELAVLIGKPITKASVDECLSSIWGIGLGLDLTLRQVQDELKAKGLPWERAKAFDGACPVSGFVPLESFTNLQDIEFALAINNQNRQTGHSKMMIWGILSLLQEICQIFTLMPGDIVMTGTPKGVGPLEAGDRLAIRLGPPEYPIFELETQVNQPD